MHSSRMRTVHLLSISPSMHCSWGVYLPRGGVPGPGGEGYLVPGGIPGLRGCTWSWEVPGPGGYLVRGVPGLGGYLVPWGSTWSRGVPGPRGVYLPGGTWSCREVYLVLGGVPGPGGFTCPGTPPLNRILDTCLWKYYLAPNFICGW